MIASEGFAGHYWNSKAEATLQLTSHSGERRLKVFLPRLACDKRNKKNLLGKILDVVDLKSLLKGHSKSQAQTTRHYCVARLLECLVIMRDRNATILYGVF